MSSGQRDPETEQVLEEFLEGQTRADQWREYKEALAARLKDAVTALTNAAPDDPQRPVLEKRVEELREMVSALATEEAVTQFVEDSVRSTLARPAPPRWDEDFDETGYG